jgi:hypothetical protein
MVLDVLGAIACLTLACLVIYLIDRGPDRRR